MPEDQKNFLFAIALSLLVIVGWEVFYSPSRETPAPSTVSSTASSTQAPSSKGQMQTPLGATRAQQNNFKGPDVWGAPSNKKQTRIKIQTDRLAGSLQQQGSVFDDLLLNDYRQNLDKESPPVRFLAPSQFDAVFGWSSLSGEIINDKTNWRSNQKTLTQNNKIILSYEDKKTGLSFKREISVDDNYMFRIEDEIVNQSSAAQQVSAWAQVRRKNYPEVLGFYLLHEGLIGFFSEDGLEEIDYDDLEDDSTIKFNSSKGWLGFTDKYWAAVLIPNQDYTFQASFSHKPSELNGADSIWGAQYRAQPVILAPKQKISFTQHFFAGAKETALVDEYMETLPIERFDLMIDWGWFFFMTKPFFQLLDYFSKLVGNFGIAILIVTVLVKLAFFPLANKSYETMAVMRKIQPDIERTRARHKNDMMKANREIAELWKKHNVKPLMGCLPMLLQIPVFFALYKVIFVTIEMRHAPFFGWIEDLSAPDPTSLFNIFGLIPVSLPDFLIIGIWPLMMGATMFVQMRLNPPPPDPIQRKVFAWAPVVITLLLARFPAGLVIYATWNTVLSAAQQSFIMKRQGVKIDLFANLGIKNESKK